eukprot:TRINITY_DN437_c0_g1_i1.p1 TRINITY_DN437_c0_g1~~TRINITY_DN437_c0_g1_i1.p1  ORF type:complete len:615 (+),score=151.54 TRINITY_DN437_c0_g1_i1:115-1845(+)
MSCAAERSSGPQTVAEARVVEKLQAVASRASADTVMSPSSLGGSTASRTCWSGSTRRSAGQAFTRSLSAGSYPCTPGGAGRNAVAVQTSPRRKKTAAAATAVRPLTARRTGKSKYESSRSQPAPGRRKPAPMPVGAGPRLGRKPAVKPAQQPKQRVTGNTSARGNMSARGPAVSSARTAPSHCPPQRRRSTTTTTHRRRVPGTRAVTTHQVPPLRMSTTTVDTAHPPPPPPCTPATESAPRSPPPRVALRAVSSNTPSQPAAKQAKPALLSPFGGTYQAARSSASRHPGLRQSTTSANGSVCELLCDTDTGDSSALGSEFLGHAALLLGYSDPGNRRRQRAKATDLTSDISPPAWRRRRRGEDTPATNSNFPSCVPPPRLSMSSLHRSAMHSLPTTARDAPPSPSSANPSAPSARARPTPRRPPVAAPQRSPSCVDAAPLPPERRVVQTLSGMGRRRGASGAGSVDSPCPGSARRRSKTQPPLRCGAAAELDFDDDDADQHSTAESDARRRSRSAQPANSRVRRYVSQMLDRQGEKPVFAFPYFKNSGADRSEQQQQAKTGSSVKRSSFRAPPPLC